MTRCLTVLAAAASLAATAASVALVLTSSTASTARTVSAVTAGAALVAVLAIAEADARRERQTPPPPTHEQLTAREQWRRTCVVLDLVHDVHPVPAAQRRTRDRMGPIPAPRHQGDHP